MLLKNTKPFTWTVTMKTGDKIDFINFIIQEVINYSIYQIYSFLFGIKDYYINNKIMYVTPV